MKRKLILGLAGVGLFVAGCVVTSVYPYYTPKDLVFEPALAGSWVSVKADEEKNETWTFEKNGDKDYLFTLAKSDETNIYSAHLFKLKDQLFMDALPTQRPDNYFIPPHYLLVVPQIKPTLKLSMMDYKWLEKLLETDPQAMRHIVVPDDASDASKHHVVLTAETPELQKFVLKYLKTEGAFGEAFELKRVETGSKP